MPSVLDFLACRQIGFHRSNEYIAGKKAVLDLLEYEAAKPSHNESCQFSGEPRATFLVDFSPNMLRAASTHGDHSVRVTDIETGKCTHVLTGHPRTPWCLAFNPTSNDILASGCLGGEVRIWDLLGGGSEVLHNPSLGAVITSLAFHPSGQVLVFATINSIYFWDWSKPTPFAVTKTNHEYERIRWLRFDPFGKYLYTGIANNTTLHGQWARTVVDIRSSNSESRGSRHSRSMLLRNQIRYNHLMERFRSLRESQSRAAGYPPSEESERPRSPVHEENLNMARQYASHITERMAGPSQSLSRSGIIRDSFLEQSDLGDRPSHLSVVGRAEGERNRGWGRYQPSFFTNPVSTLSNSSNDNSNTRSGALRESLRHYIRPARLRGRPRSSVRRSVPYAVTAPSFSALRSARRRNFFNASELRTSSSTSSSSDDLEPNHHLPDELEPDEFEILPIDQSESLLSETTNAAGSGGANESRREFDGMSASEMAQRLEQQLRQLRRDLFQLTQRNMDINSTLMTLPSQGSSQSSPRPGSSTSILDTSNPQRSAFRSAGSALSRSMFSRSESNTNTSTSSSILSSALSTTPALSLSSSPASSPSMLHVRSIRSTSTVPFISYSTTSGLTRSSIASATNLPSSPHPSSRMSYEQATARLSSRERQSLRLRAVPTTVTDSTSQTFGAMNLPEQLDRSTDMTGLDSNQPSQGDAVVSENGDVVNDISDRSYQFINEVGRSVNVDLSSDSDHNGYRDTQEQSSSLMISDSTSARTVQTQVSTVASHSACSTGILRSALTSSSASSQIPPLSSSSSLSSSTQQNAENSALINGQVFRSIGGLRRQRFNPTSEGMFESQVIENGDLVPHNSVSTHSNENSSSRELREGNMALSDLPVLESTVPNPASSAVRNGIQSATTVPASTSIVGVGTNTSLRTSIVSLQRRLSDVLQNIRASRTQQRGTTGSGLEQVEDRFLSQTSQMLSQTTAYWTEFLGRSVMELNQRISELERRLETNQYLLSSSNPFRHQRPGRPQDALMSSLFTNRSNNNSTGGNPAPADNQPASPATAMADDDDGIDEDRRRRLSRRASDSTADSIPPPPPQPATAGTRQRTRDSDQVPRNQMLLDFLVWRGLRDSQSQRSLSFGQSDSRDLLAPSVTLSSSSSSLQPPSFRAPILSSTLSANSTTSLSSSTSSTLLSSIPQSVTIHPSREEESEGDDDDEEEDDDDDDDFDGEEDEMMQEREERGARIGRRRLRNAVPGSGGDNEGGGRRRGRDSSWLGLTSINLHPDYSSSILDDTVNRPNQTMQHIMNRTIAGVLEREEQAVANNIIPQTHRIQRWNVSEVVVPSISRVTANIVVEQCKLHNDASCDISKDGTTLATFVPSHRGFPDDNVLGVFSLRKETFAQCLYTKSFGPNAISVSISPANHYVMVGLAARRYFLFSLSNKMVGQVYKLVKEGAGEKSMEHITDLFHPRARGVQLHVSVNFGRWLPGIGEGLVYGTNRGDLQICRPGPRQIPELDPMSSLHPSNLRRSGLVRSSIATQTTTGSIRRTASTQTQQGEDGGIAGPSRV